MTSNYPTSIRLGHRRRTVLAAVVLTALAAVLALVLSASLGAGRSSWSFGPFAGYTWRGHVTSVSASWTVPSVTEGSRCADAATWIGAAARENSSSFVQIGINERRCYVSYENQVGDMYSASWSDVAHHEQTQPLFPVNAGDDVKASLEFTRGRSTLTITDTTTGRHARFSISTPGDAAINEAEWIQEDVTNSTLDRLYPYPHLTAVGFDHLEINSQAPAYPDLYSSWMSVGSTNLAPTPLYHDSFTIGEAKVSEYGAQYLRIAIPEDTATDTFIPQLARWTTDTAASQIDSARSRYAIALRKNISALTSTRWPTSTQDLVDSLTGNARLLLDHTQSPTPTSSAGLASWRSIWKRDAKAVGSVAHTLKRDLNVPDITPASR